MTGEFVAIDWGTTNRRAYVIDKTGDVVRTDRDGRGTLAVGRDGFAAEASALSARYGGLPMLLAGMVGSNRGWHETAYVPCPADLDTLARNVHWVEPARIGIVPGVSQVAGGRADVMRGEEVQLFGAVAGGLAPGDALLCQPGTHCKWAWMKAGRIDGFTTAMTGEMFALLKSHGLLSSQLHGPVEPGAAFVEGVADAARHDLLATLFGTRAAMLLGKRDAAASAAYVSGLLIGSDVEARLRDGTRDVHMLADPTLAGLYAAAIEAFGGRCHHVDSHAAFVAGITSIWRSLP